VLECEHLNLPESIVRRADEMVTLEEAERRHIVRALERTGGVLAGPHGAAALLGINRSTLWSRMKKLGIEPLGS
jgi:transcriptional regulator with GAF, ATPase, and Fis domain